ncbi:MAG: EAL domain-containing protein [Gammaproteobacteria bacterium]|nr:EAL domain-containing protein [Gammaproteobacteria bacterium]
MANTAFSPARFQHYWKLLKLAAPWINSALIFNQDGHLCWQSDAEALRLPEIISPLLAQYNPQNSATADTPHSHQLESSKQLLLFQLSDSETETTLSLALICNRDKDWVQHSSENRSMIQLLNQSLLTEYALRMDVQEQEEELDAIASELTHRYEELNLIFSSDNHVQNLAHGRELLQQILVNASNFLDVDLVAILLPGKNFSLHYAKQNNLPANLKEILSCLRNEMYPALKKLKSTIVINHPEDARGIHVVMDTPHKFIIAPLLNVENEVIGLIAIINQDQRIDFSNSDRNLLEVLANKATATVIHNFDPLTGLENSHSFEMIVMDTLKQSWQNDSYHTIANIDIDRMAVINAVGGLEAGDRLIKKVAATLTRMVRSCDTVARLGADKFAVLLKNCDLTKGYTLMQKISQAVTDIDMEWKHTEQEISISIGLAPITADIQNVTSIFGNVESARIAAKERGRNQIQVFKLDDSDLLRRREQITWVSKTQSALRNNQLVVYAQRIQPIIPNQQLPHFEILIRMLDEEGKIIAPGYFLPAAEAFYLMPKLDRWVIQHTFELLSAQQQQNSQPSCEVSINLSGQSLTDSALFGFITGLFNRFSIDPKLICFEVTETAAVANLEEAQAFIKQLRSLGCSFSLDDFGSGLSSFAYLKSLEVDYLKIDGMFVKNITEDPVSLSMVSAINQVGHSMQLKTIAEYVENESILQCLKDLGVDYAQGYLINKPQPFAEQLENLNKKLAITMA